MDQHLREKFDQDLDALTASGLEKQTIGVYFNAVLEGESEGLRHLMAAARLELKIDRPKGELSADQLIVFDLLSDVMFGFEDLDRVDQDQLVAKLLLGDLDTLDLEPEDDQQNSELVQPGEETEVEPVDVSVVADYVPTELPDPSVPDTEEVELIAQVVDFPALGAIHADDIPSAQCAQG